MPSVQLGWGTVKQSAGGWGARAGRAPRCRGRALSGEYSLRSSAGACCAGARVNCTESQGCKMTRLQERADGRARASRVSEQAFPRQASPCFCLLLVSQSHQHRHYSHAERPARSPQSSSLTSRAQSASSPQAQPVLHSSSPNSGRQRRAVAMAASA